MMRIILSLIGIVGSFFMLKYRERVGDMFGEADWMRKVGGIYNIIIVVSLFFFFWGLAGLTNTQGFFFGPLRNIIPGLPQAQGPTPEF